MTTRSAQGWRLSGWHVFWAITLFFVIDISVNAFFITRALTSFPGEDAANSYVQGVAFNQTLAQREAQRQLGWTAEAGLVGAGGSGSDIVVRMRDPSGQPLAGLRVAIAYHLAGRDQLDHVITLKEDAPGDYAAALPIAGPARVEMVISARKAAQPDLDVFEASKTLVVS